MPDLYLLHQRYQQQAEWTHSIRQYLLAKLALPLNPRVLEVGCGTGVILAEVARQLPGCLAFGIDIDIAAVQLAQRKSPFNSYAQCNAADLPFPDGSFDLVCCHYFLLWANPLQQILQEINRQIKPGGTLIAFAEPDYGGRIDHPPQLAPLAELQERSLRVRGAHTRIGRELGQHLLQMGLERVETGVLGGQWQFPATQDADDTENAILQDDLEALTLTTVESELVQQLITLDEEACRQGTRLIYLPTFYAVGFKPAA
ncbi:MAG: class I SAM-dependent methyltransferase [Anaerolineae bacterium]|nr:class I SAM-dependent methyltransferase [Anaerolineae bacterium]